MSKSRYWLNLETLSFEPLTVTLRARIWQAVSFFTVSTIVAIVGIFLYTKHFDTPKTMSLKRNNAEVVFQLELLKRQFQEADGFLSQLELRDNNVYRPTFGMEVIPSSVREQGIGGADRYTFMEESKYANLLIGSSRELDKLMKKIYVQSVSFEAVRKEAANINEMTKCVPAIQPVSFSDRVRVRADFGPRIDPFYKDRRMHEGIDIGGPVGEPVFATGNGRVEKVEYKPWGYGRMVLINHGFGYKTRYGHLQTIEVSEGQEIIRGQRIATLGSTGKSTSPHLHYEVIYRNRAVNPINYFANDMTEIEYENMLQFAQQAFGSEY